ncbi:MAG: hypothetical protein J6N71_02035 [Muribaculaceae bacterium]|nr:hypothetical protein [Muribaculaceae bacterium]
MKVSLRYVMTVTAIMVWLTASALTNEQKRVVYEALPGLLSPIDVGDPLMTGYVLTDLDGDEVDDLVLESLGGEVHRAYSVGRDMASLAVTGEKVGNIKQTMGFMPIHYMTEVIPMPDYTLSQVPLMAAADVQKSEYIVKVEGEDNDDICPLSSYTQMVFKPHVNRVKMVKSELSVDEAQTMCHYLFFKLADPSVSKKMFRGYKNEEIMSVIVTDEFLTTHIPQQYSRWKSPEPIVHIDAARRQAVQRFFGRQVMRSQWLATCPTEGGVREFYFVTFDTRNENVCSALVCLADGEVASFVIIEGYLESGEETYYNSSVDDLYDEHLPEIMAIMDGPMGLELYVRYNSMEGTHYCVWREVGKAMISVIDQYLYWGLD